MIARLDINKEAWRIIGDLRRNGEAVGPYVCVDTVRYHAAPYGIVPKSHSVVTTEHDGKLCKYTIEPDAWLTGQDSDRG